VETGQGQPFATTGTDPVGNEDVTVGRSGDPGAAVGQFFAAEIELLDPVAIEAAVGFSVRFEDNDAGELAARHFRKAGQEDAAIGGDRNRFGLIRSRRDRHHFDAVAAAEEPIAFAVRFESSSEEVALAAAFGDARNGDLAVGRDRNRKPGGSGPHRNADLSAAAEAGVERAVFQQADDEEVPTRVFTGEDDLRVRLGGDGSELRFLEAREEPDAAALAEAGVEFAGSGLGGWREEGGQCQDGGEEGCAAGAGRGYGELIDAPVYGSARRPVQTRFRVRAG
jgi:hypothetical protein